MDVTIHLQDTSHQQEFGARFARGLLAHGIAAKTVRGFTPTRCDLAVFWGHSPARRYIIESQRACGLHYLVMERGYFADRLWWTSIGYDGLNGRANFLNDNVPGDRWQPHRHLMKPWRREGEHIVVMGQVQGDAAVRGVDIREWSERVVSSLMTMTKRPIVFRPHPRRRFKLKSSVAHHTGLLGEILMNAHCAVTYNSNSGVDATLEGVPTVTLDHGSMAWAVSEHEFDADHVECPVTPERTQWAHKLAYAQWSPEEISSGVAWDHLRQMYS